MPVTNKQVEFKFGLQQAYDSITAKDPNTVYFCTDSTRIYLGDRLMSAIVNPSDLYNSIYPVNICIPFYDDEDHADFLGMQWERAFIGTVPVGINYQDSDFNSIGKVTGEKSHTLTIEEMPSHNHELHQGSGTLGTRYTVATSFADDGFDNRYIANTGGDAAHNNIQPSEVVAWWRRTQ